LKEIFVKVNKLSERLHTKAVERDNIEVESKTRRDLLQLPDIDNDDERQLVLGLHSS
jgi:hypothetical protein